MLVDVEQVLRALDAPPGLVAEVSALARMANTEWRNLRELRRKGLGTRQAGLKSLEASSTQMRYFLLWVCSTDAVSPSLGRVQPGDRALGILTVVEARRRPSRARQIAAGERLGFDRGPVGAVHHGGVSFHVGFAVLPVVGRRHEDAKLLMAQPLQSEDLAAEVVIDE